MLVQPYCGAVGVAHGSTQLLTNESSPRERLHRRVAVRVAAALLSVSSTSLLR
jgi:hypothetical protein